MRQARHAVGICVAIALSPFVSAQTVAERLVAATNAVEAKAWDQAATLLQAIDAAAASDDERRQLATKLGTVASAYSDAGKPAAALPLCERRLVLSRQVYGADHAEVASGLASVAACLMALGRAAEALQQYEAALAMRKRLHGDRDHLDVARSMRQVGVCLQELGRTEAALARFTAALAMHRSALAMDERLLGDGDLLDVFEDLVQAHARVAQCLEALGRVEEASLERLAASELLTRMPEPVTMAFDIRTQVRTPVRRAPPPAAVPAPVEDGPDGATPDAVTLERHGTLEAPDTVPPGAAFTVQVSLTEEQLDPVSRVSQGDTDAEGRLRMHLPATPEQAAWDLDVVLSAPCCTLADGRNVARITLPRRGDSTPARFDLVAPAADAMRTDPLVTQLHATLWHRGVFLGRVSRSLTVRAAAATARLQAATAHVVAADASFTFDPGLAPPDLSVYLRCDPADPERRHVTVASRWLEVPVFAVWEAPGLAAWLHDRLPQLAGRFRRGRDPDGDAPAAPDANAALVGFGRELFARWTPPVFRECFLEVWRLRGARFTSIAVYSDEQGLPWELMRPTSADGATDFGFLGVETRLGRWPVSASSRARARPAQALVVRELTVLAPRYGQERQLPAQQMEMEGLRRFPGYRAVDGTRPALGALLSGSPSGIVHFAGHGAVVDGPAGTPTFAIRMEDGDVDLATWRGLSPPHYTSSPFFFLNACEVGQARRVANFVDGWAPTVLDCGATGCIGALYPIGDAGAAAFAVDFYARIATALASGSVPIAEVIRATRKERLAQGDATGLAYVFYGDPELRLEPAPRAEAARDGR